MLQFFPRFYARCYRVTKAKTLQIQNLFRNILLLSHKMSQVTAVYTEKYSLKVKSLSDCCTLSAISYIVVIIAIDTSPQ